MGYMSQEKKTRIASELKTVMPKDWKYSLAVRHHSTIVLTINSAPIDLIKQLKPSSNRDSRLAYAKVNHYNVGHYYEGELLETFEKIRAALNIDNHYDLDAFADYANVGHYVDIRIGKDNKPFQVRL